MTESTLRFESIHRLDDVEDEWRRLADTSANVFATWEWATVWWRHFGRDRQLLVARCHNGSRVVGILPLYLWGTRPARVVRFLGHGPADQLGPICAHEDRREVAVALRTYLTNAPWQWDVFLAEQLPGDEPWPTLLRGRLLRREGNPVLRRPPGGWEDYLRLHSANFRQQIRGRERRLAREHQLEYRLATDSSRLTDDLTILFELHRARWAEDKTTTDFGGWREAFHRDFAALALDRGWLRLWFLELDGRAVAAWYGFRFGGVESYYQAGRDPAWDHRSVGFVLLAHSIRAAFEDDVSAYRFLRGDDPYKYRFTREDNCLDTVATSNSALGVAAVLAAEMLRRTPRLRRALRTRLTA